MERSDNATEIVAQLHIEIVGGCQLRCLGCPNSTVESAVRHMSVEDFISCINNVDVKEVLDFRLFNYGEPLLHPDLTGIGRALEDHAKFSIRNLEISTNAQTSNFDALESFLRQGQLTTLVISCDGDGTADSYERLRPPAKWSKLLRFFEYISELRNRCLPDLRVITRNIIEKPADAVRWREVLASYGIEAEFRGWKQLPQASQNMTGRKFQKASGICFFVQDPGRLFVNYQGHVVPCCVHPNAGFFGDLKSQLFSDMLTSEARADFCGQLQNSRNLMTVCAQCEFGPDDNKGPSAGTGLNFNI